MAGTTTEITALRAFPYSKNGFTIENADIGDSVTLDARIAQGLVDEGFAELANPPAAKKTAGGQEQQAATGIPSASETPATGFDSANSAYPMIDIPADWAVMHHLKQINLAKQIDPAITTKADAVTAIEAYLSAKAE